MKEIITTTLSSESRPQPRQSFWHDRIYARFHEQAHPCLIAPEGAVPSASLWTGARLWVRAFRTAGLCPGDRVVLAVPPSAAFVYVLLAALWEGLTLAVLRPEDDVCLALEELDARAGIALHSGASVWQPDSRGLPGENAMSLRRADGPATPDARILLQSGGSTGRPQWIALSDGNLHAALTSHMPLPVHNRARVLSVLPWFHAFGLLLDLLPALFAGAEIVRDPANGEDVEALLDLMDRHRITHFSSVPVLLQRIARNERGQERLHALAGGVVGGAPVNAVLMHFLKQTSLQIGYGQTEGSAAITLGAPGRGTPNYIGRPVNCELYVDPDGRLHFRGPNACLGIWTERGLYRLDPDRWACTNDIVRQEGLDYFFVGRADDEFILSDGWRVRAGIWENRLKREFPELDEAMLFTRDGDSLELVLGLLPGYCAPSTRESRRCLDKLGSRLHAVHELAPACWRRSPKGDIDRKATLQMLDPGNDR